MVSDSFDAEYEVDDGYVGKAAPQRFSIHSSDIEDDMEEDELAAMYEDMMAEHFEMNIHPYAINKEEFIQWGLRINKDRGELE